MEFPLKVESKLINPGVSNAQYPHLMALTYFQGQQIIAYGCGRDVVIASNSLAIITSLRGHNEGSNVTAVAWAPYSGRLSSCGTDLRILIWEPDRTGWYLAHELSVKSEPTCLSWSICDHKFCVCTDVFTIYQREPLPPKGCAVREIYTDNVKAAFCSHSRDSRFILTLQGDSREVVLYHKRESSTVDYCKIPLKHPSRVKTVRWRTSDQLHERCCFMTVAEDMIVRIWSETGVNEALFFNVVAAIPASYGTQSAAFISTTARLVSNNPVIFKRVRKPKADTYAYGHGHFPIRDRDAREARIADERELNRNRFWFLTIDNEQRFHVWEMSGISAAVRRTPALTHLISFAMKIGLDCMDMSHVYASCRLDSEISHFDDKNFVGKPASLSLIVQNGRTKVLTTLDVNLEVRDRNKLTLNQIGRLHGHDAPVTEIRVHSTNSKMASLDEKGFVCIWTYNDTDVYDPIVLIKFEFQLTLHLQRIDWLEPSDQLFGYNGSDIFLIEIPERGPPLVTPTFKKIPTNWKPRDPKIRYFRMACELSGGFICIAMFAHDIYFIWLVGGEIHMLKHIESDNEYVDCTRAYITRLLPFSGATVCFWADQRSIYCSQVSSSVVNQKNMNRLIVYEKSLTVNENIHGLCVAHPGWLFVACDTCIHICWRVTSSSHDFEILHTIPVTSIPRGIACIPTGMLSVVTDDSIDFYYPMRKSYNYLQAGLEWTRFASYETKDVNAMEWTLDGLLLYATNNAIYTFTKFMDTFFLETSEQQSYQKLPTIHHTLANFAKMIPDFHPATIIPLAVNGRFTLLMKMFKYLYERYNDSTSRWFYTELLLQTPQENADKSTIITEANEQLLTQLSEKIEKDPIPEFSEKENRDLVQVIRSFFDIVRIPKDALDQRGLVVARAIACAPEKMIPYDLITLAYMSQDQDRLLTFLKLNDWKTIEASGVFFWYHNVSKLCDALIPFAMDCFAQRPFLSIILLTVCRRFKFLKMLFQKSGDDTRAQFFVRDFTIPKNRVFAEKNGYSALGKQDYHIAAAMFFLADRIDLTMRVILQNLRDAGLAYFVARCRDDGVGELTTQTIKEFLIPHATESDDAAALAFFQKVLGEDSSKEMAARFRQAVPANMCKEADYFCDQRFNTCQVLNTSLNEKSDLILSYLLTGQLLLSVHYLPYFDNFVLNTTGNEPVGDPKRLTAMLKMESVDVDVISAKQLKDVVDDANVMAGSKWVTEIETSDDDDVDDEDEDPILIEPTKEISFGFTLDDMNESDETSDSDTETSTSEIKSESSQFRPLMASSKSLSFTKAQLCTRENRNLKVSAKVYKTGVRVGTETMSQIPHPTVPRRDSTTFGFNGFSMDMDSDEHAEEDDFDGEESNIEWFGIVIVFNIARLRLEAFLETQNDFTKINDQMSQLYPELNNSGAHIASMIPQLMDYMVRSCKRRCFVFRRVLLLRDDNAKSDYMIELCKYLSLLPDQMLAYKFTSQQTVQISQTVTVLIRCVNQKVIDFSVDEKRFKFIMASICTALFIIAMFYHNVDLMRLVLSLDLEHLTSFPDEIDQLIGITLVGPGKAPYGGKRVVHEHNFFSFLSVEKSEQFYVEGQEEENMECLPQFGSSLIDFMLIDTFLRHINDLSRHCRDVFRKLLGFLFKLHDTYMQLFGYATLNFPVFLRIKSLSKIRIRGDDHLNSLMEFLLSLYDRNRRIPCYCKRMLNKFTDTKKISRVTQTAKLHSARTLMCVKTQIHEICLNRDGTRLFVASSAGMNTLTLKEMERRQQNSDESGNLMIEDMDDLGEEMEANASEVSEASEETWGTSPEERIYNDIPRSAVPVCITFNPSERVRTSDYSQVIVGYADGSIWNEKFGYFTTPKCIPCASLACSSDGSLFAAVHRSEVRLWSCYNEYQRDPFMVMDTLSESTISVDFLTGTGLLVTHQICSPKCKANLAFWDILMPSKSAMVASIKLTEKYGRSECMAYCPRYNQIIVGTNKGNIVVVDTRQFMVVSNVKAHKARHVGIGAIGIDENQTFFATGSTNGVIKVWDITTSQLLQEKRNVHHAKVYHSRGKARTFGITSIAIRNDAIYTSGVDGYVKCTAFT